VPLLRERLPGRLSVCAFGRRITGQARPDSDLDLAVLVAGYADVVALWSLASEVAECVGCEVDLLDMRAASTVLQDQILTPGQRLWAILNLQRPCEACLDMGQYLLRRERLGLPQSARDVFGLLAQAGWIEPAEADVMKRMVGFRNIAVHDCQALQLPITLNIIEHHLGDFLADTQ